MKSVISSTYDDRYLFFLPIISWCWNKLGVDVICFLPQMAKNENERQKYLLAVETSREVGNIRTYMFDCPEHKEATYSQCSRLYGACLDLPEDEVLITSDVDMAVFKLPEISNYFPTIVGADLVPDGQYPMCYASMTVKDWRLVTRSEGKTYQQCLDEELGDLEAEQFRGNFWSRDQELLYKKLNGTSQVYYSAPIPKTLVNRSNGQNQFAQNRVDRDDTNWRSYVNDELIDAHLWRDGFTDENHANIMELMRMKFPDEDFTWLTLYRNEYLKLI